MNGAEAVDLDRLLGRSAIQSDVTGAGDLTRTGDVQPRFGSKMDTAWYSEDFAARASYYHSGTGSAKAFLWEIRQVRLLRVRRTYEE
jgi:hypothetical protein